MADKRRGKFSDLPLSMERAVECPYSVSTKFEVLFPCIPLCFLPLWHFFHVWRNFKSISLDGVKMRQLFYTSLSPRSFMPPLVKHDAIHQAT